MKNENHFSGDYVPTREDLGESTNKAFVGWMVLACVLAVVVGYMLIEIIPNYLGVLNATP